MNLPPKMSCKPAVSVIMVMMTYCCVISVKKKASCILLYLQYTVLV